MLFLENYFIVDIFCEQTRSFKDSSYSIFEIKFTGRFVWKVIRKRKKYLTLLVAVMELIGTVYRKNELIVGHRLFYYEMKRGLKWSLFASNRR